MVIRKLVLALAAEDFPELLFVIYIEGRFFSQLLGFLRFRANIARQERAQENQTLCYGKRHI